MSGGDATMVNSDTVHAPEHDVSNHEIYKSLRRRSTSLALILTLSLPLLLLFFNIACTPRRPIGESFRQFHGMLVLDFDCLAIVLGWLLLQTLLFLWFGKRRDQDSEIGPTSRDGMITLMLSLCGVYLLDRLNIIHGAYVYDNAHKILFASIVVAFSISALLYIKGSETRRLKQIHPIVAFFYGTDVNLIIAGMDLKLFFELRAGLIGWACLNLCFLLKTMELYTYRRPPAFVLVVLQQILQAFQLTWYEDTRLQKKETVGFIRVFGSLCWFPFLWCLPSQYLTLINYPVKRLYILASAVLFLVGMLIYRSAHNQQETIEKSRQEDIKLMAYNDGFPALTASYLSLCRHPYYLGNLLMLISWSLPCGTMPIPWMLPAYYLLVVYHKIDQRELFSH